MTERKDVLGTFPTHRAAIAAMYAIHDDEVRRGAILLACGEWLARTAEVVDVWNEVGREPAIRLATYDIRSNLGSDEHDLREHIIQIESREFAALRRVLDAAEGRRAGAAE